VNDTRVQFALVCGHLEIAGARRDSLRHAMPAAGHPAQARGRKRRPGPQTSSRRRRRCSILRDTAPLRRARAVPRLTAVASVGMIRSGQIECTRRLSHQMRCSGASARVSGRMRTVVSLDCAADSAGGAEVLTGPRYPRHATPACAGAELTSSGWPKSAHRCRTCFQLRML